MHASLSRLVAAKAFPGSQQTLLVPVGDEICRHLEDLARQNLVMRLPADDLQSGWRWTQAGFERLRFCREVSAPQSVFRVRANLVLKDASDWELLSELARHDWQMLPVPSCKRQKSELPPYTAGASKTWYNNCMDLSRQRQCILALLGADDAFGDGVLTAVHHCQSAAYYKKYCLVRFQAMWLYHWRWQIWSLTTTSVTLLKMPRRPGVLQLWWDQWKRRLNLQVALQVSECLSFRPLRF